MKIIGGEFSGRVIHSPKGKNTRPTSSRVKESLFNFLIHGFGIDFEGMDILDIFAGSGSLGIEALSRGARFCNFIDIESGESIKLNPSHYKDDYLKRIGKFLEQLRLKCLQYKIDLVEVDINKGYDQIITSYLLKRQKMFWVTKKSFKFAFLFKRTVW